MKGLFLAEAGMASPPPLGESWQVTKHGGGRRALGLAAHIHFQFLLTLSVFSFY